MTFDKDSWIEIAATLRQNKLRSFLTASGVFWGIFLLIIMVAAGNGLYNGAMHDFQRLAANSVFLWTMPTTKPYKGLPRGRKFTFNNDDIAPLRQHIPEIEHLAPRNQLGGYRRVANVTRGSKNGGFNVYGDYPEITSIALMDIVAGRFINHLDLRQKRKVAVIGTRVREILFDPDEDPIERYILIKGVYFRVVGVFESRKEGDEAEEETQAIFIPFTTFQVAFNYKDLVMWFSLTARKGVPASAVEKTAIAFLAQRHHVAPDDAHAIGHWNTEKEYKKMTNPLNTGTTTATIADMGEMIFNGKVDESDVGKIKPCMDLILSIGAIEKEKFDATLEYIAPKGVEEKEAIQFEVRAKQK